MLLKTYEMASGAYYDRRMPRGEPKVMFSARLPGDLVARVVEAAREACEPRSELVERALEAELDRMERATSVGSGAVR